MVWRLATLLALGVVSAARKTIDLRALDEAYNDEDEDVWKTKKERRLEQESEREALLAEPDVELPEGGGSISRALESSTAKAYDKITQWFGGAAAAPLPGGGPPPGDRGMPPGMADWMVAAQSTGFVGELDPTAQTAISATPVSYTHLTLPTKRIV